MTQSSAIFAFKLILTPLFIGSVTLAGRRWGPVVSGLLLGLPLTTGPVSLFLAIQYGSAFAAKSAIGVLTGGASVCIFCLAYNLAASHTHWFLSAVTAVSAFLLITLVWDQFSWTFLTAFLVLLGVIGLVTWLIPHYPQSLRFEQPPAWDLPARMAVATLFVLLLTGFAGALGPQLSGLLSPLPVFGLVTATFTHHQQGRKAASTLLHGIALGSLSFASFFLIVELFLNHWGITWTYLAASVAAVFASGMLNRLTK